MEELTRCDACSASAYVRYKKGTKKILDFCGHHANRHAAKLAQNKWKVVLDTREEPSKSPAEVA